MFTKAIERASAFTRPVVLSQLFFDGTVDSGLAAFIVLNDEGWILTAGHLLGAAASAGQHQAEIAAFKGASKSNKITKNPKWLVDHSYWWSGDGITISDVTAHFEIDLAVGRLEPWDSSWMTDYPVFRDWSDPVAPGNSVCRLGFPFHEFKATHIAGAGFELPAGAIPAPIFPLDGIVTRFLDGGKSSDGKYDIKFVETSTPGLRGQSGGPLFDVAGRVVGLQSRTNHLDLGFEAKPTSGGKIEKQFLNVGCAVHFEVIRAFLTDLGINFQTG